MATITLSSDMAPIYMRIFTKHNPLDSLTEIAAYNLFDVKWC